jgi:hypothetical protein
MRIIRVFPRATSYTPCDGYVRIGSPTMYDLILPPHDEIHISCTFSWDKPLCRELKQDWELFTDKPVKLGGPAFGSPVDGFVQGLYLRPNIIFTSRGCNNHCPWCIVPKLEGRLVPIDVIPEGNIIQDNNFLQCDRDHKEKVIAMLRTQKGICFKGGLEADLVDDDFVSAITSLRIKELWLACDLDSRIGSLQKACEKLKRAGFNRNKIYCYVLSYGKNRDADESRARAVYEAGAMPFVQLYRDFTETKTEYSKDWNAWARAWQRPAIIKARMEKGTKAERAKADAMLKWYEESEDEDDE